MSLRIRRGTESQRTGVTFDAGELVYTTDSKQLWIGDGVTAGGSPVVGSNITGYGLTFNATSKKIEVEGLTADDVANGVNNQYFSTALAQAAVAPMFTSLDATHTNIQFQYDEELGVINATVTLDGIGLTDIIADTSPQLGGNLDLNSSDVTGTGNIDITGNIDADGNITATGTVGASSISVSSTADIGVLTFSGEDSVLTTSNVVAPGNTDKSDAPIYIGTDSLPATLWMKSAENFAVLTGLTDGTNVSGLTFKQSRGSLASPTALLAGDPTTFFEGFGYNGVDYVSTGVFGLSTDPDWDGFTGTSGEIPSQFGAIVLDVTGAVSILQFNSRGVLNVPIFKASGYATGSLPTAGTTDEGFIVFDSTTKEFKGWNGTSWVVLG